MRIQSSFVLYGATGHTGTRIARRATELGLTPILAGRNAEQLRILAHELGVDFVVARLEEPPEILALFQHSNVLLNAAGPFATTAAVLHDSALKCGAHYLDISGEHATIARAASQHGLARANHVMVMPGVGFDVVATDCLAVHVSRELGRVDDLSLALFGIGPPSRGSALTMAEQAGSPVGTRRNGQVVGISPGSGERTFRFGDETIAALPVSWADIETSYLSTGARNITVYFEATPELRLALTANRTARMLGVAAWGRELARVQAGRVAVRPPSSGQVRVLAEAVGERGRRRALLWTPDVYAVTADAAVAVIRRVLLGDWEAGFQTPGRVYGPDFVLSLPGVRRTDIDT